MTKRRVLALLSALLAVLLLGWAVYLLRPDPPPAPGREAPTEGNPAVVGAPSPEPSPTGTPGETDGLPVGKWVITPERQKYEDSALTLLIPSLNVTRPILDGTDKAALREGVGLYDYAQLPGEGNRNVSLAGHRNGIKNGKVTDDAPFYYVDRLSDGDYLYLCGSESIYRYVYGWTDTVEPGDWGPIATTGESCLTLTSCTPIGISDHRIVIRAQLDAIFDYAEDFDFAASEEDLP